VFVTPFLRTVSDQTANVSLNSNGRYIHYVLITIHNFVYMLMICFLHSQLHKTNMKTLFACRVNAWLIWSSYSSLHCYIQCWMEGSAECGAPDTLLSPLPQYLLNMSLGGPQGWSGNVAGMKDIFYLQQVIKPRLPGCPAGIAVAIPTELSGVPYMSLFLD
jgi:hypothetical protein